MANRAQNYPLAKWRATVLVTIIFRVSSRSADDRDAHRGKSRRRAWLTRYKESFICLFVSELIDIFRALAAPTRLRVVRSEEHTSELQSINRISSTVFCLQIQ